MKKVNPYLTSAVPQPEKAVAPAGENGNEDRFAALESRIEELNQLLIKQNRDNQDYQDNIDEENLSESLLNIIKDLNARVTALEEIVNAEE